MILIQKMFGNKNKTIYYTFLLPKCKIHQLRNTAKKVSFLTQTTQNIDFGENLRF